MIILVQPKGQGGVAFASLKAELKRLLIARASGAKTISIAPAGTINAVTDLTATPSADDTQASLTWTEALPGDYDNNGTVDAGDLVPIAQYYMQRTDGGADDGHKLVEGDDDPGINIADLQAVANNYMAHLQGYQVWRGRFTGTFTLWDPAFRSNPNSVNPNWSADRPSPPPVSTRPSYSYVDNIVGVPDITAVRYIVVAYGDGAQGKESDEALLPMFSVSGRVLASGSGLSGVAMRLTPGGLIAITGSNGGYTITCVADGSYTLTAGAPPGSHFRLIPASKSVTVAGADITGVDFASTGLADSPWPKFHGNSGNTGQSAYVGAQTNHLKWSYATGYWVYSSPAIGADGTVYVGSEDNSVYALNPSDGSVKWSHATGSAVRSSPAIGMDGTVYVGSDDFKVYALDPSNGSVKWTRMTGYWVESSPAVGADGTVYVGSNDKKIYALDPADGSVKWSLTTGSAVRSSPAISVDGTLYVGSDDHNVYALNPTDGSVKWAYATRDKVWSSPVVSADGTVYVGSDDNKVYALSPSDGSVKWSYTTGGWVASSPAIGSDGTVYAGCDGGTAYALNPTDGSVKWICLTGNYNSSSSPAIGADGTIYVGSDDRNLFALRPEDGSVKWSYTTGSSVYSSPAIAADGTVYIGSGDGKLYAFGP